MAHEGDHVDTGDQLSSMTLLAIAIVGGLLTVGVYALIGS